MTRYLRLNICVEEPPAAVEHFFELVKTAVHAVLAEISMGVIDFEVEASGLLEALNPPPPPDRPHPYETTARGERTWACLRPIDTVHHLCGKPQDDPVHEKGFQLRAPDNDPSIGGGLDLMPNTKPSKAQLVANLRSTALGSHRTGDEMTAMADGWEWPLLGHECGHQFTISFTTVMHSGIAGEGPQSHRDGGSESEPRSVTVRAHDLPSALRRAAALPLSAWYEDEEEAEART